MGSWQVISLCPWRPLASGLPVHGRWLAQSIGIYGCPGGTAAFEVDVLVIARARLMKLTGAVDAIREEFRGLQHWPKLRFLAFRPRLHAELAHVVGTFLTSSWASSLAMHSRL